MPRNALLAALLPSLPAMGNAATRTTLRLPWAELHQRERSTMRIIRDSRRGGGAMTLRIALLLAAASLAVAGENSWDNLQRLHSGEKIEVIDAGMKRYRGEVLSVTEEAISLRTEGGETRIERPNVARVSLREHSKRLRNLLIGAAAGAAAGGAAMALWVRRAQPIAGYRGEYYDIGKYIFLPAGLGAGAAIGAAAPRFETIYRAAPATR